MLRDEVTVEASRPASSQEAAGSFKPGLQDASMHPCAATLEGEERQSCCPLEEIDQSTATTPGHSDLPSSVAVSEPEDEGEEMIALQSSNHEKCPMRGVLRAVSSITITDIEAFEEGISIMRESSTETPASASRKVSPTNQDASPSVPMRAPSDRRAVGLDNNAQGVTRPRRGGVSSRRQKAGSAAKDSLEWYLGDDSTEGEQPSRPPFFCQANEVLVPLDDTNSNLSQEGPMHQRRKSSDLLPNVPRRMSSSHNLVEKYQDTDDSGDDADTDDVEFDRLIQSLHGQVPSERSRPEDLEVRRRNSMDLLPSVPRSRSNKVAPFTKSSERFDRFSSESCSLLTRHQSFDYMHRSSAPTKLLSSSPIEPPCKVESESEQEGPPFKVREFLVSLDDLEDKKTNFGMPKRRRSFDALPTPPRRFLEEIVGLDTDDDDDDDEEINSNSARRRSFDDIASAPRRPNTEAVRRDDLAMYGYNVGYTLSQSLREDGDRKQPVRHFSADILPSLPRRRLPSYESSDDETSCIPLKSSDDALRSNFAADFLPNAPRRTDSGIHSSQMSRSSSASWNELEETTLSFGPSRVGGARTVEDDLPPQRPAPCDTLPSIPIRDFSIPDIDIDNISIDVVDLGGMSDKAVNGGETETDLESDVVAETSRKEPRNDRKDERETVTVGESKDPGISLQPAFNHDGSKVDEAATGSLENDNREKWPHKASGRRSDKSGYLFQLYPAKS